MGRTYAGVLGLLAFALVTVRGAATGASLETAVLAASGGMFLFAALGYLAGQTADYLVGDSVRTQFRLAMTAAEAKTATDKTQTRTNS